jgi:hypothetical protein
MFAVALWSNVAASACGGTASVIRRDCPPGQTSLDGTCVSQSIADYVVCLRATGAMAHDGGTSDVTDKLERSCANLSSDARMASPFADVGPGCTSPARQLRAPTGSGACDPGAQSRFAGRWYRREDGAIFDVDLGHDCSARVTLPAEGPAAGYEHSMRGCVAGNEIVGRMTRTNPHGCTVILHVRLALQGDRILESVEGVEGQCDIGPGYREFGWLSRTAPSSARGRFVPMRTLD